MTRRDATISLVLGGARSGKSRHAEALCRAAGGERLYVATAEIRDEEMRERIERHRAERDGDGWITIEEPRDLAGLIARETAPGRVLLVDCLTIWLTNILLADADIEQETDALVAVLKDAEGPVVLVANEVGYGIVPDNKLARDFRDHAGILNQKVAAIADRVALVVAGIAMAVKEPGAGRRREPAYRTTARR